MHRRSMTHLEFKHLQMVKTIAKTGNLTQSTKALHVSQPALSRQLLDLEDRLGAKLFNRTGRNMILTDIGEDILEIADDVLEKIEQTEYAIENKIKGNAGQLKIGVHCVFCFKWLPAVISKFQIQYPSVTIEINSSDKYVKELDQRKRDMIITPFPLANDNITYQDLFSDDMVVTTAPDFQNKQRHVFEISNFANVSYLSFADQSNDALYNFLLKPEGIEPKRFMTINQAEALIQLVKSGLGVAMLPKWAVKELAERGDISIYSLDKNVFKLKWFAATTSNRIEPRYQSDFIKLIQNHAARFF